MRHAGKLTGEIGWMGLRAWFRPPFPGSPAALREDVHVVSWSPLPAGVPGVPELLEIASGGRGRDGPSSIRDSGRPPEAAIPAVYERAQKFAPAIVLFDEMSKELRMSLFTARQRLTTDLRISWDSIPRPLGYPGADVHGLPMISKLAPLESAEAGV
jgi:hypothetical protein